MKLRGAAKRKTTDKDDERIREEASRELLRKLEKHFSKTDKPFW